MSSPNSWSSRGQGSSWYSTSTNSSLGLPGDEFRTLKRRQNRDRLENHFSHRGASNYSHSRTAYQDAHLGHNERVRISEVKNATRKALGSNFDFTDNGHRGTKYYEAGLKRRTAESRRDSSKYEVPIPQKYLDEYYEWSRKYEEKYEAHQSKADYTFGAPWRTHDRLHVDPAAVRPSTLYRETPRSSTKPESVESNIYDERGYARPPLVSKFSFDSDVPPKRSFFRRR